VGVLSQQNMLVFGACPVREMILAPLDSRRIHDALLTRLSNDDDMEKNLSTFASEMTTSAMVLG
jgi:hypothetical protein